MNCSSVEGFCLKTTSERASGSRAPLKGDSLRLPPFTMKLTTPHSSVRAFTIRLESL